MRLTDIVSSIGLTSFAEVGLIIFLIVYVAVTIRALWMKRSETDEIARLPLDDDEMDPVRFSKDPKHGA